MPSYNWAPLRRVVEESEKNSTKKVGEKEWEAVSLFLGGGWQSRRDAIKFRQRTSSSSSL
jgi:hypothetical protein